MYLRWRSFLRILWHLTMVEKGTVATGEDHGDHDVEELVGQGVKRYKVLLFKGQKEKGVEMIT